MEKQRRKKYSSRAEMKILTRPLIKRMDVKASSLLDYFNTLCTFFAKALLGSNLRISVTNSLHLASSFFLR